MSILLSRPNLKGVQMSDMYIASMRKTIKSTCHPIICLFQAMKYSEILNEHCILINQNLLVIKRHYAHILVVTT